MRPPRADAESPVRCGSGSGLSEWVGRVQGPERGGAARLLPPTVRLLALPHARADEARHRGARPGRRATGAGAAARR